MSTNNPQSPKLAIVPKTDKSLGDILGPIVSKLESIKSVVTVVQRAILQLDTDDTAEIAAVLQEHAENPLYELIEELNAAIDPDDAEAAHG